MTFAGHMESILNYSVLLNEGLLAEGVPGVVIAHYAAHEFLHSVGRQHDNPVSERAFNCSVFQLVPASRGYQNPTTGRRVGFPVCPNGL
jgi:hypothetical protein